MKRFITLMLIISALTIIESCSSLKKAGEVVIYLDTNNNNAAYEMLITVKKGISFNHPTYAIWEEDMEGNYIRTIFITKSYASGVFGHQMIKDSIWLNHEGTSFQPAALPYWTFKKGLIAGKQHVPTPDYPFIDGYTCATPQGDFQFKTGKNFKSKQSKIMLELNQSWDWNKFWTNNKFPKNYAYKHSAQPSIIYAVVLNEDDGQFFMNPIGHGDPKGETGKLFTDISSLTTAMEIFESIEIQIKH